MFFRVAAFLAAAGLSCVPVRAAEPAAPHWQFDNPFCSAIAAVAPLRDGSGYALDVAASSGTTIAAHVTLVSASAAYDAHLPDTNLSGPVGDRRSEPVVVKLPSSDALKYVFLDSYAIDRGTSVTCPSYVFPVGEAISGAAGDATVLSATPLQTLGHLTCGAMYQEPSAPGDAGGLIGRYGNRPLSVELRVYVDSGGRAIRQQVLSSSGVEGVDAAALGIVTQQQYRPAKFLCTPVVGELRIRLEYQP
jgi:TonB family protein